MPRRRCSCSSPYARRPAPRHVRRRLRPCELGTQKLRRCQSSPLSYCGTLSVPLEYGTPTGPQISIAYRFYPATAPRGGRASGTVVPVEGGPGYPSIGSVAYPELGRLGRRLQRDVRAAAGSAGTCWRSTTAAPGPRRRWTARRCRTSRGRPAAKPSSRRPQGARTALNHRWKYPDGGWVHASDLFTSAPAAEDLAAVITALELGEGGPVRRLLRLVLRAGVRRALSRSWCAA